MTSLEDFLYIKFKVVYYMSFHILWQCYICFMLHMYMCVFPYDCFESMLSEADVYYNLEPKVSGVLLKETTLFGFKT